MTCDDVRGDMAVALLTHHPVPAAAAAHLDGCPACRVAIAELAPLPALLAAGPPPAAPPDDDLLPRLLTAAARERRRRRRAVGVVSAAVAAAVVALLAGLVAALHAPDDVPATAAASSTSAVMPRAAADVVLHPAAGGTVVDVAVTGLTPGTVCTVQALTRDGGRYDITTWQASDYGTGHVRGRLPATVSVGDVTAVELVDRTGAVLTRTIPAATR